MKNLLGLILLLTSFESFSQADATSQAPFGLWISPKSTYLRTDTAGGWIEQDGTILPESSDPPLKLDLLPPIRNVKAGDVIKFNVTGFMKPDPLSGDTHNWVGAVFVDAGGQKISPFGLKRTKNAYPVFTPNSCTSNRVPTDIAQDFALTNTGTVIEGEIVGGVEVEVPIGATAVLIGVIDCYYADNKDPNIDLSAFVQIQIIKSKYKIKKIMKNMNNPLADSDNEKIVPKKVYGITKIETSTEREIYLSCYDEKDILQADCKMTIELRLKAGVENNGGHAHETASRPLGYISIDGQQRNDHIISNYKIASPFSIIKYEAPEVSGVVELVFYAFDKNGDKIEEGIGNTNFTVRINEDLVPISIAGLTTQGSPEFTNPNEQSHPREGYYLTDLSHQRLKKIVDNYREALREQEIPYIQLRSTAASLKWGGLYDVSKGWNTIHGHTTHRGGNDIDLSTHAVFGQSPKGNQKLAIDALKDSIIAYSLGSPLSVFPETKENPETNDDHWHVFLNKVK